MVFTGPMWSATEKIVSQVRGACLGTCIETIGVKTVGTCLPTSDTEALGTGLLNIREPALSGPTQSEIVNLLPSVSADEINMPGR
jgi:hypothetical protein